MMGAPRWWVGAVALAALLVLYPSPLRAQEGQVAIAQPLALPGGRPPRLEAALPFKKEDGLPALLLTLQCYTQKVVRVAQQGENGRSSVEERVVPCLHLVPAYEERKLGAYVVPCLPTRAGGLQLMCQAADGPLPAGRKITLRWAETPNLAQSKECKEVPEGEGGRYLSLKFQGLPARIYVWPVIGETTGPPQLILLGGALRKPGEPVPLFWLNVRELSATEEAPLPFSGS